MRNYCALADSNYLIKLLCLLSSMERHLVDYHVYVLALDDAVWTHLVNARYPNVTMAHLSSLESGELVTAKAKRTHQEYCWLLASQWTLCCMLQGDLDNICYLDSDSYFFADPQPVFDEIDNSPVAIPPHRFAEKDSVKLENGRFNVNFVVFQREGLACLQEWAGYALEHCYSRVEDFGDQKIFDALLPKYNGHAIANLGCNCAPWNGFQYFYNQLGDAVYVSDGVSENKLCLYHAHELLHSPDGTITRRTNWEVTDAMIRLIYEPYQWALYDARKLLG